MKNLGVNCFIMLMEMACGTRVPVTLAVNISNFHARVAVWAKPSVLGEWFWFDFLLNLFKCKWKFKPSFHVIKNRLQNFKSKTCWDFIGHLNLLERFELLGALVVRNTRALKFSFRPKNFEVNEWLVGTIQNKLECV